MAGTEWTIGGHAGHLYGPGDSRRRGRLRGWRRTHRLGRRWPPIEIPSGGNLGRKCKRIGELGLGAGGCRVPARGRAREQVVLQAGAARRGGAAAGCDSTTTVPRPQPCDQARLDLETARIELDQKLHSDPQKGIPPTAAEMQRRARPWPRRAPTWPRPSVGRTPPTSTAARADVRRAQADLQTLLGGTSRGPQSGRSPSPRSA